MADTVAAILAEPFIPALDHGSSYPKMFLRSLRPDSAYFDSRAIAALGDPLSATATALGMTATLLAPLRSTAMDPSDVVLLGVFFRQGRPVGFFGYIVLASPGNHQRGLFGEPRTAFIHSLYFSDSAPGVTAPILDFFANAVAPVLGVGRETIHADFSGRYVFAKLGGFAFDPATYYYDTTGKTCKTVGLARASLARFLTAQPYRAPLVLNGTIVESLDMLQTPSDFADLRYQDSSRVVIRPLINQQTLGALGKYHPGQAFMLSDYRHIGGPTVLSQGGPQYGAKFSAAAMPWWRGFREVRNG